MTNFSVKRLSILSLVLVVASVVTAAIVPNKLNGKRINNGTLRAFSNTASGADQDAPAAVTCTREDDTLQSCTATDETETTTGFFANESLHKVGRFNYQTRGNTSQTGGPGNGDQNSISDLVA